MGRRRTRGDEVRALSIEHDTGEEGEWRQLEPGREIRLGWSTERGLHRTDDMRRPDPGDPLPRYTLLVVDGGANIRGMRGAPTAAFTKSGGDKEAEAEKQGAMVMQGGSNKEEMGKDHRQHTRLSREPSERERAGTESDGDDVAGGMAADAMIARSYWARGQTDATATPARQGQKGIGPGGMVGDVVYRCRVFIVPQGMELDSLVSTSSGRGMLLVSSSSWRLVLVYLNRGHQFESALQVQQELAPCLREVVPQTGPDGRPLSGDRGVPYGTMPFGIGRRTTVDRVSSSISGPIAVEDVELPEAPDGSGPFVTFRWLVFLCMPHLIQSIAIVRSSQSMTRVRPNQPTALLHPKRACRSRDRVEPSASHLPGSAFSDQMTATWERTPQPDSDAASGHLGTHAGSERPAAVQAVTAAERGLNRAALRRGPSPAEQSRCAQDAGAGAGAAAAANAAAATAAAGARAAGGGSVDHSYLACDYISAMVAGLSLIGPKIEAAAANGEEVRVLVLGLGSGALPMFLHTAFPFVRIDAVELDPAVVQVASRHFAIREDHRLKIHIEDAAQWVIRAAAAASTPASWSPPAEHVPSGVPPEDAHRRRQRRPVSPDKEASQRPNWDQREPRFHAVLVDVDAVGGSGQLFCPPPPFLDPPFLSAVRCLLSTGSSQTLSAARRLAAGVLALNMVSEDDDARRIAEASAQISCALGGQVYAWHAERDRNRVLFCVPEPNGRMHSAGDARRSYARPKADVSKSSLESGNQSRIGCSQTEVVAAGTCCYAGRMVEPAGLRQESSAGEPCLEGAEVGVQEPDLVYWAARVVETGSRQGGWGRGPDLPRLAESISRLRTLPVQ